MRRLQPEEVAALREWLSRQGLRGADYREEFLGRRLLPRMEGAGFDSVRDYLASLRGRPAEQDALLSRFLVHTTEFFRNPEVWEALRAVLPRAGPGGLSVLSAPCSTGEEAFSAAVLLERDRLPGRVVAADLSGTALKRLREGRYPARALEKVDRELAARYFKLDGGWAMPVPRVRARVLPVRWDLGRGLPGKGFHVALLRNLFIYLTAAAQARLVAQAGEALVAGGLLVLGRVERLPQRGEAWDVVDGDARIYRWKGGAR